MPTTEQLEEGLTELPPPEDGPTAEEERADAGEATGSEPPEDEEREVVLPLEMLPVQDRMPPTPGRPICISIVPGQDQRGAHAELNSPELDSGEWVPCHFRRLYGHQYQPDEKLDPLTPELLIREVLERTPIQFHFHGKTGELRLQGKKKPLTILPGLMTLTEGPESGMGPLTAVRVVDGAKPVLEVNLAPGNG